MKSYFLIFHLTAQVKALFSQPNERCSKANSYDIKPKFEKI